MKIILNHSPLIVASFFILLAGVLLFMNYSQKNTKTAAILLSISISISSIVFFINPPLIPNNWHYLAALSTFFLMITFLNQIKNKDKLKLILSSIPFLLLEVIFLFKINNESIYTALLISLIWSSFVGVTSVFKKA